MLAPEAAYGLAAFALGHFGDAAGVHDADVGYLAVACTLYAVCLQPLGDGARLGVVQLAAKGKVGRFLSF